MGFAFLFLNCNIRFGFCNFTLDKNFIKAQSQKFK